MKLYRIECKIVENMPPPRVETPRVFIFSDIYQWHEAKKWLEESGHKIDRANWFIPDDIFSVKAAAKSLETHD